MTPSPLDRETLLSLIQAQIIHYLMLEKYALRGDRNSMNDEHVVITPEEITSEVEQLFCRNNEDLIEKLWWIIHDAFSSYETTTWDLEIYLTINYDKILKL